MLKIDSLDRMNFVLFDFISTMKMSSFRINRKIIMALILVTFT